MKLTITIEEDERSEVRVEKQAGATPIPAGERAAEAEPAAMNAGGPPDWLLAEVEGGTPGQVPAADTGDTLDAGPAPASVNGVPATRM